MNTLNLGDNDWAFVIKDGLDLEFYTPAHYSQKDSIIEANSPGWWATNLFFLLQKATNGDRLALELIRAIEDYVNIQSDIK